MKVYQLLLTGLFFFSCKPSKKANQPEPNEVLVTVQQPDAPQKQAIEETWIDDFKNLRTVLYQRNAQKLKAYISFPFRDVGSTVFHLCKLSEDDWNKRKIRYKDADLFYEEDLDKYHKRIFGQDFISALMKVKSDRLFKNQQTETQLFEYGNHYYKLYANYNTQEKTLVLNLLSGNNFVDDEGNHVSEGEHNIIYTFEVINDKKLMLARVDLAG